MQCFNGSSCECDWFSNSSEIGVLNPVLPTSKSIFLVTDMNNNIIFRANDTSSTFHKQRVLVDAAGATIVTFRNKGMSAHYRWQAFKGDSIGKNNLIFNAKQSSSIHSKVDLNIYLAGNDDEKICDYKLDSSFVFYVGDSNTNVIATAQEHIVKVEANVDIAFIVSLIVIADGIREQEIQNRALRNAAFKGGAVGGAGVANAFELI